MNSVMKAWSVIGLIFAAAIFATIPISPQVTPRGVELSVDQAQAITYGRYRRVTRRAYRRGCGQASGGCVTSASISTPGNTAVAPVSYGLRLIDAQLYATRRYLR